MRRVNELTVCREDYDSKEEFENAIKDAVMVLLNNNYIMTIKYDDKGFGIVWIQYDYAEKDFGGALPYWLLPKEEETVVYKEY